MKTFFDKLLLKFKMYWQFILICAGAIVGFIIFRKREISFRDSIEKLIASYTDEINRINAVKEEERLKHIENQKKLEETLTIIQNKYDLAKKELDDQKKKEIENIVKQYGDNPEELAKRLSSITGLSIIVPS